MLLVSLKSAAPTGTTRNSVREVTDAFARSQTIAARDLPSGRTTTRHVTFIALSGYKGL